MLSARRPGRVVRGLGRAFLGIYLSIYVSKITCHFCPRLPDFRSFVRSGDKLQRSRIPSTLSSWVLAEPPSKCRRRARGGPRHAACFRWRPRPFRAFDGDRVRFARVVGCPRHRRGAPPIPPLTPVPNLPRTKCPRNYIVGYPVGTGDKLQGSRALALLYYSTCREIPGDTGDSLYDLIL